MTQEFVPNPFNLTLLIIEVLKGFFSSDGTEYKYIQNDSTRSTISILDGLQLKPDEIQKRPAIITKRGGMQIDRFSIGDRKGIGNNQPGDNEVIVSQTGSYTVNCISSLPRESERIAGEVLDCLLGFQTIISRDYGFLRFTVEGVSETTPYEEYKEFFNTSVQIRFVITNRWVLAQASPLIKRISKILKGFIC